MEPEIARRCQTCGAAVRGTARFCPQCGQLMAEEGGGASAQKARAQPTPRTKSALVDQAERVANSLSGRLAPREPVAEARADADGDVLSLGDEPAANTGVDEIANVAGPAPLAGADHVAEPVAAARADEAGAGGPVAESARATVDGARADAGRSVARERGAPPVEPQDAPAEPAPLAGDARAESADDARGAGRVRRATAAAGAGLGESVRPRVGKLREASVVVFAEAAEDPGMRFVVIAALLFVVALLILLFSFVLR